MVVYTLNIDEPIKKEEDDSYVSGDYSLKLKGNFAYIYIGTKQVRKIKLEISKEVLARYGYCLKKEEKRKKYFN